MITINPVTLLQYIKRSNFNQSNTSQNICFCPFSRIQFVMDSHALPEHRFCPYLLNRLANEMFKTYQRIFCLSQIRPAICSPPSTKMLLLELPISESSTHRVWRSINDFFLVFCCTFSQGRSLVQQYFAYMQDLQFEEALLQLAICVLHLKRCEK